MTDTAPPPFGSIFPGPMELLQVARDSGFILRAMRRQSDLFSWRLVGDFDRFRAHVNIVGDFPEFVAASPDREHFQPFVFELVLFLVLRSPLWLLLVSATP